MAQNADALSKKTSAVIKIEGHCDSAVPKPTIWHLGEKPRRRRPRLSD
jgi:outer membrane protein OmpA-like peptidoglycan-associated protein